MKFVSGCTTRIKKIGKPLLISILFLTMSSSSRAEGESAEAQVYTELGLALAGIPFDIAAHHYAITNKKKTAALLHLTTDTISILNKICCLYNGYSFNKFLYRSKKAPGPGRDFFVNSALALRDAQKWYYHLKDSLHATNNEISPDEQTVDQTISRLAYTWQVVIIPCLKGLTASALAFAPGITGSIPRNESNVRLTYNHIQYVTTFVHALTKLFDEYATLAHDSPYKKWLASLIVINILWLAHESYELKNIVDPSNDNQGEEEENINMSLNRLNQNDSALFLEVKSRHYDLAKEKLDKGANVNAQNIFGDTPLHIAVKNDDLGMVMLLLRYDPRTDIKNNSGRTAYQEAPEDQEASGVDAKTIKEMINWHRQKQESSTLPIKSK